jgi:hypothetical protein
MLYQLSYSRESEIRRRHGLWWREEDSNLRRLTPADLQSAPFGHSGIPPQGIGSRTSRLNVWAVKERASKLAVGIEPATC